MAMPCEHAEQGDAEERGDREQELGAALAPQPHRARDVGQRQRRGDDDGGERRLREVAQQPGHEHEHEHDRRRADDAGELRLARPPARRPPCASRSCSPGSPGRTRRRRWPRRCRSSRRCRRPPGPVRAANADAVEIVSVSATSAMPERAGHQQRQVGRPSSGTVSGGKPCGSVPTSETPWSPRSSAADAAIATTTATSTPGTRGSQRASDEDQRQAEQADRDRGADRLAGGEARRRSRAPRRSGRPRRPRSRTAWAAGRSGSSARGRSCSRSASAWRAGRRRTRAWRSRPRS